MENKKEQVVFKFHEGDHVVSMKQYRNDKKSDRLTTRIVWFAFGFMAGSFVKGFVINF